MQSSNKAKRRLSAKHTVLKEAHKKPEKSPERAPDTGVSFLTVIPKSSDAAATVANLPVWQKILAKINYRQNVELFIRTPRLFPSIIPHPHVHYESETSQ